MGVHVHYLTISENQRCVHYLDSKFMCHATVNDLLTNFIGMINNVDDGSHIIQDRYIKQLDVQSNSLDGQSNSRKFLEMLQKDRIEKEQHKLANIRSCILHIIHSAFKTRTESSGQNIKAIFKGAFTILHDTSAKREDYIAITGEERSPLLFCATGCVENAIVADRLIEIWDSIIKILDTKKNYRKASNLSQQLFCKSFLKAQQAVNDQFSLIKFRFFSFVGKPFLTKYQTSYLMLPYMYYVIKELVRHVLHIFVIYEAIEKCNNIGM